MSHEILIKIRDLGVRYDSVQALEHANLDIYADDFIGVIGPNGAGKTNICQSLILLSSLPSNEIKETLNFFGGASSVFNKKSTKRRTISIKAEGEVEAKYPTKESYEEFKLTYLYAVEIRLQANNIIKINEVDKLKQININNEIKTNLNNSALYSYCSFIRKIN